MLSRSIQHGGPVADDSCILQALVASLCLDFWSRTYQYKFTPKQDPLSRHETSRTKGERQKERQHGTGHAAGHLEIVEKGA